MDSSQVLIWSLLALNVAVAAAVVLATCASRRGVEVNHLLLFVFGFLFYWILPVATGSAGLFREMPGMELWYGRFEEVAAATWPLFLGLTLLYLLSFVAGSLASERVFANPRGKRRVLYFHRSLLHLYLVPGVILAGAVTFALRDYLFRGYAGVAYEEVTLRGSLISASLFLLVLALLHGNSLERVKEVTFRQVLFNRFFAAYFAVAVAILGLGGRLYFISSIFMLLVYRTVFFGRIRLHAFAAFLLVAAFVSAVLGVVRFGMGLSPDQLLMSIGAEPLFTSFSLIDFLRAAPLELLNLPVFLMSDFVNLVPTVLFPMKHELMLAPSDHGYDIFSPFGALNSFVSFMINFGMLGTALVLFAFGAFLGLLKAHRESTVPKILYIMISGWLAFTFFRDPFSVSLVKAIFQFSILTPLLVILSLHVLSVIGRTRTPRPRESRLPAASG